MHAGQALCQLSFTPSPNAPMEEMKNWSLRGSMSYPKSHSKVGMELRYRVRTLDMQSPGFALEVVMSRYVPQPCLLAVLS